MSLPPDMEPIIDQSESELFKDHSSSTEILLQLEAEEVEEIPDDFLEEAIPREPNDILVLRGTKAERFNRRSWKEEKEYRDKDFHQGKFIDLPSNTISAAEFEDYLDRDLQSIITHDYGICSECNGTPESDCERCGGDTTINCNSCNSVGSKSCPECQGTGDLTCPECEGREYLPCATCDGEGDLTVEDVCPNCTDGIIQVNETCSKCQGEGKLLVDGEQISCSRCSSDWSTSSGVVAVKHTCSECGGRGATRRSTTCNDCGGSQRQECSRCSSSGHLLCGKCQGDGDVVCQPCDGNGERSCPDCADGTVICSVCDGDRETHSVVCRRTAIRPDNTDMNVGKLPHGITNPDWEKLDPTYFKIENRAETPVTTKTTEINIDQIEEGQYIRYEVRYVTVREVTYDYGEQNFRVRELNGDIHYTRHPEPEDPGLFDRVRSLF